MIELLLSAENTLALGLLDQTERTYRQVLAADPHNAIAVVGLARVALERGDEAEALELARSALAMDPENATARRMIERLEEVERHRAAASAPDETAAQPDAAVHMHSGMAPDTMPVAVPATPPDDQPAPPPGGPPEAAPQTRTAPNPPPSIPPRPGLLRRLIRRS